MPTARLLICRTGLIGLAFTLTGGPALPTIIGSFGLLIGAALFCVLIWRARLAAAD